MLNQILHEWNKCKTRINNVKCFCINIKFAPTESPINVKNMILYEVYTIKHGVTENWDLMEIMMIEFAMKLKFSKLQISKVKF